MDIGMKIKNLIPFLILGTIFAITLACSGTGGESREEVELETKEQIIKEEVIIEETEEELPTIEKSYLKDSLAAESAIFTENIFSFNYPSNWRIINEEVVDSIFETSMRGWPKENFEYIGGVYIGEKWEEAIGEAVFSLFVISDPNFNGTITDEQYENVKNAYESEFGNRLLYINRIAICDLPAIEMKTIGKSDKTQNWGIFIVPEVNGRFYNLDLRTGRELYPDYELIFIDIIDSLEISK
jgi:hypothetical protein